MEKIILASTSPRRREILQSAGIEFKVIATETDESFAFSVPPQELVMGLASRKLRAVKDDRGDETLILAADTVVYYDGVILGKPSDEHDAFRMLTMLSDSWHEVYTGIAMSKNGKLILDYDVTRVKMRRISDAEIKAYIESGEPLDKAGAYAIQELGGVFVEKIDGNFHTVVGLPLCLVVTHLAQDYGMHALE